MMRAIFLFVCFLFILGSGFCVDRIVAVVNKGVITEKELNDYFNLIKFRLTVEYKDQQEFQEKFDQEKELALENLIESMLIVQEAKRAGLVILDEWVDRKFNEFVFSFKSREEFEKTLMEKGLSIAALKEKTREQLLVRYLIDAKIKSKIKVTPQEITDYYKNHKAELMKPDSLDYKALKFSQKVQAYRVFDDLKKSLNLEQLFDKDAGSFVKGTLSKAGVREELEDIFRLEEGGISTPIEIEGEFYIFIVDKKYPPQELTLEEAKAMLWDIVYQEKFTKALDSWLKELKDKAVIKIIAN